ncbi:MAG: phosphatase PAP2 family protein [Clostridia bacterium]|nr:phosphatase PAP2 family protein [Clostridia bacterium]
MLNKRAKMLSWICLEICFLVVLILATLNDFELSFNIIGGKYENGALVVVNTPLWTKILMTITELIIGFFSLLSFIIVAQNLRKKAYKTPILVLVFVFDFVALIGGLIVWNTILSFYISNNIVTILVSTALSLISFFLVRKAVIGLGKNAIKSLFAPALYSAFALVIVKVCLWIISTLWGRLNIIEITQLNAPSSFTNWYQWLAYDKSVSFVQNVVSRSGSFPSNIISMATLLLILPNWINTRKAKKACLLLTIVVSVLIAIIAVVALFSGLYYLSDIVFGFAISYIVVQVIAINLEKDRVNSFIQKSVATTKIMPVPSLKLPKRKNADDVISPITDKTDYMSTAERNIRREGSTTAQRRWKLFDTQSNTQPNLKKPKRNTKFGEIFSIDEATATSTTNINEVISTTQRTPGLPALEIQRPVQQETLTSFSLAQAREEKEKYDEQVKQRAEVEGVKLDEQLKIAETGEISLKDLSKPVVPDKPISTKAGADSTKKKSTSTKKKTTKKKTKKKKSAKKPTPHLDGIQMHFKYDDENQTITSEITAE